MIKQPLKNKNIQLLVSPTRYGGLDMGAKANQYRIKSINR